MNGGRQRIRAAHRLVQRAAKDEGGAAAIEFALLIPVLALLLLGTLQAGVTLNNYIELTDAVRSGARQLAIGRATSTPYTSATATITSAASALTSANISITAAVNGAACASNSACSTALSNGVGGTASVTATYPCDMTIMGVDFAPNCTLRSTTTDLVE
jgi:Flp pilus assembly protein TadG